MEKLNPWKFGAVVTLTVLVNYVICTIFWYAFSSSAIAFMNGLFHGMDFGKIYTAVPFSMNVFLYVLLIFAVWTYMLGVIFAMIRNRLLAPRSA